MIFRFRLEKALNFLRLKETTKRMEVAALMGRLRFLKGRMLDLEKGTIELLERGSLEPSPQWLLYQTSQISRNKEEFHELEGKSELESKELKKQRGELTSIVRKKKGLESLKETRLRDFRVEQNRRAQRELDEIFRQFQNAAKP